MTTWRSSRSQMFFKIDVLKKFTIFTGKHLCSNNFIKKRLQLRFFPINIAEFLTTGCTKLCNKPQQATTSYSKPQRAAASHNKAKWPTATHNYKINKTHKKLHSLVYALFPLSHLTAGILMKIVMTLVPRVCDFRPLVPIRCSIIVLFVVEAFGSVFVGVILQTWQLKG